LRPFPVPTGAGLTVIEMGAETLVAKLLSMARAMMEWAPVWALVQVTL